MYRHKSCINHLSERNQISVFPPQNISLNNVQMEMQTGAQILTIRRNNQIFMCQVASRRRAFVSSGDTVFSLLWFSMSCYTAAPISALLAVFLSLVQKCCSLRYAARLLSHQWVHVGVRPQGRPEPAPSICHPPCNCILTMTTYQ